MTGLHSVVEETWFEEARRAARAKLVRGVRRTAWSLGKLTGIVVLVGLGLGAAVLCVPERPDGAAAAPTRDWIDIRRPIPIFGLSGTDFSKLPLAYSATRDDAGGRRDWLTFGDLRGDDGWLRLSFYRLDHDDARANVMSVTVSNTTEDEDGRDLDAVYPPRDPGGEASPDPSIPGDFAALVRDVAGGVGEIAAPTRLRTRFGPFEAMEMRIAAPDGPTPCLGFRSVATDTVLRVSGLACGGRDRPVGRDLVTCVIDRIDLRSAGDDESLRALFTEAERRRGVACAPASLTQVGSRLSWIDANSSPPVLKP